MELYKRIKQRREELGISQDELAKMLGYKSRSTIAKIEKGENDITQSKIAAFAKALQTTPSYLMGWEDDDKKENTAEVDKEDKEEIPVLDDPDIRILARNSQLTKDPAKQQMLKNVIKAMLEDAANEK